MKNVSQIDRIKAAMYLGVDRMHPIRHAALRLALMERHEKIHPDRARILALVDRFKIGDAFGFYASRPEYWRVN